MQVYSSNYWTIAHDAESKTITTVWNEKSAEISDEIYKYEMLQYIEQVEKYPTVNLLVDTRKFGYLISPDIQEWTNQTIFPRGFAAGLRKVAIVVPKDIITQLSLEQTMMEVSGQKFFTKYFDLVEDAKLWLVE